MIIKLLCSKNINNTQETVVSQSIMTITPLDNSTLRKEEESMFTRHVLKREKQYTIIAKTAVMGDHQKKKNSL